MTALKKNPASVRPNGIARFTPESPASTGSRFNLDKVRAFVAELEVPFSPSVIEWRVVNVSEDRSRGQVIPYADQRAYTDRLNELFTPAGWTRKYTVHTSATFERSRDNKVAAKVFVTCDLTIHGIGSHSATGEEWTDNENAGTSAEAQAFKRACSCFGLGRYLYNLSGVWVDLNEHGHPAETPHLGGWATPEGWRKGLRPLPHGESEAAKPSAVARKKKNSRPEEQSISPEDRRLIQQIEAMAEPLGKAMYRGLLKTIARVWRPSEIHDRAVLEKVSAAMQSAAQGLRRLEAAQERIGPEATKTLMNSLHIRSVAQVDNLETLQHLVQALEENVDEASA
ncbi:MAG TPA: Rad52/Rad22 family DNA repair protein [Candidatus Angelobacter sp.]|nr:Rad52/Rad22 family DNA repair protein [Candidatus Angelobacter sp.]